MKSSTTKSKDTASTLTTISVEIWEARDLLAADQNGSSDPYAVAELVDSSTGKIVKGTKSFKTPVAKKTLNPVWARSEAQGGSSPKAPGTQWEVVDGKATNFSVRLRIFDSDFLRNELLGECIISIPEEGGIHFENVLPSWYSLEATQGAVCLKIGTKSSSGDYAKSKSSFGLSLTTRKKSHAAKARKKKITCSSGSKMLKEYSTQNVGTLEDRLRRCQKKSDERLDCSRLLLGDTESSWSPIFGKECSKLVYLNLKNNNITNLPSNLSSAASDGCLPVLESLILSSNKLQDLPRSIANLGVGTEAGSLSVLAIDSNRFTSLPEVITTPPMCYSLMRLFAHNNLLAALPDSIGNMAALDYLHLGNNPLKQLPANMMELCKRYVLSSVVLTGCPCYELLAEEAMRKHGVETLASSTKSSTTKSKDTASTLTTISVEIWEARDLLAADQNGSSDPYAVAELVDSSTGKIVKGTKSFKTPVAKKTLNPVWARSEAQGGNSPKAPGTEWNTGANVEHLSIRLRIMDDDFMRRDASLGEFTINARDLLSKNQPIVNWRDLSDSSKMKSGSARGSVKVFLKATCQQLRWTPGCPKFSCMLSKSQLYRERELRKVAVARHMRFSAKKPKRLLPLI